MASVTIHAKSFTFMNFVLNLWLTFSFQEHYSVMHEVVPAAKAGGHIRLRRHVRRQNFKPWNDMYFFIMAYFISFNEET